MLVSRYMLESDEAAESPLTSLSVKNFVRSVGSRTPAPGGGSVAALIGSLVSLISPVHIQCIHTTCSGSTKIQFNNKVFIIKFKTGIWYHDCFYCFTFIPSIIERYCSCYFRVTVLTLSIISFTDQDRLA